MANKATHVDLSSMHILLVGATGIIGNAVHEALLEHGHRVIAAGHTHGKLTVDLSNPRSIEELYTLTGSVDAVICAAGRAQFGPLDELGDDDFNLSIRNKMMGQVNLVRSGLGIVAEGGSFTLTTGGLSQNPEAGTSAVSMVGAGSEAFARGAAIDLKQRYRVNVVSPGWVAETRQQMGLDPMPGIWAKDLAKYYVYLAEGTVTGEVANADEPLVSS